MATLDSLKNGFARLKAVFSPSKDFNNEMHKDTNQENPKSLNVTIDKLTSKNITTESIQEQAKALNISPEELLKDLKLKGLAIPEKVTEEISSGAKEDLGQGEEKIKEQEKLSNEEKKKSDNKTPRMLEDAFKLFNSLIKSNNYEAIVNSFDKEDIVAIDSQRNANITRQGAFQKIMNDKISDLDKYSEEEQIKMKEEIAALAKTSDINGKDIAEKRTVMIRGESKETALTVNDMNDENITYLIGKKGIKALKEVQLRDEFTPGSDNTQRIRKSALMTEVKDFFEFKEMKKQQVEGKSDTNEVKISSEDKTNGNGNPLDLPSKPKDREGASL